jgi:hypothetical protein
MAVNGTKAASITKNISADPRDVGSVSGANQWQTQVVLYK